MTRATKVLKVGLARAWGGHAKVMYHAERNPLAKVSWLSLWWASLKWEADIRATKAEET